MLPVIPSICYILIITIINRLEIHRFVIYVLIYVLQFMLKSAPLRVMNSMFCLLAACWWWPPETNSWHTQLICSNWDLETWGSVVNNHNWKSKVFYYFCQMLKLSLKVVKSYTNYWFYEWDETVPSSQFSISYLSSMK